MYASIVGRKAAQSWQNLLDWFSRNANRFLWMGVLILVTIVPLGWVAHTRGRFSRLKSQIRQSMNPPEPQTPRPGGQDAILLQRPRLTGGAMPEFASVTILPGRGMNVLQIMAYLPGKGEVPLLASPGLDEAAAALDGAEGEPGSAASLRMGGAIEAPWAGRIHGVTSPDGRKIFTQWRSHSLALPIVTESALVPSVAQGGLLLSLPADSSSSNVMPDGGEAHATFQADDFGGRWPSKTEVTALVLLSGRVLDLKLMARNVGSEPEPVGLGWHPRFLFPSGNRSQVTLRLPTGMRMETHAGPAHMPTGRLLPVEGTPFDFTARGGALLGPATLDEMYTHLRPAVLDLGPAAELRDPASNLRLRITAMTPMIRALRVFAPADQNFIQIGPQLNLDDPFGREWPKEEDTGMVVLQPGQTVQWKVRLELFPLSAEAGSL